ncbi:MAG: hypothetical protein AAGD96_30000 [Chloroflexota bacterium]
MKKIVIDGSQVKRRRDLKQRLNMETNFSNWYDSKADEYIDKVSGYKALDHFKEAEPNSDQLEIVIENSEELFKNATNTFGWFVEKVMKFNRRYQKKRDTDEAPIVLKLV